MKKKIYMRMVIVQVSLLLLFFPRTIIAQYPDSIFHNQLITDPGTKNILSLSLENSNFVKNNEYFSPFADGYTLIGYFIRPELKYQPGRKTSISAGIHFLKYSGLDKFSQILPTFSFRYSPHNNFSFILGSLQNPLSRNMEDQILNYEKYYTQNLENGAELLFSFKNFRSDLWLSWEKFIKKNDPFREHLVFGTSSELFYNYGNRLLGISFPLQTLIVHKGGQIDSSLLPVETYLNTTSGIDISIKISKKEFLGIKTLFLTYNDVSKNNIYPYQKGTAFQIKTYLETKRLDFSAGYWNGTRFIAPKGNPVYSSVFKENTNTGDPTRKLITGFIGYKIKLDKIVDFIIQGEAFFDMERSQMDFNFGLSLLLRENFFIKDLKSQNN